MISIKKIAEFVEDEAIFMKLKEIGVDFAQWYWIAKPAASIFWLFYPVGKRRAQLV